jgi:hypothetical protein
MEGSANGLNVPEDCCAVTAAKNVMLASNEKAAMRIATTLEVVL